MSNRPFARIVAKHKKTEATFDVGTLWPTKWDGTFNMSPITETDTEGPYPKLALAEAITSGEYYLNVYEARDKKTEDDFGEF